MIRFYRDRGRVIGAAVPPVIFWFFIGSGLGGSFSVGGEPGGLTYLQYFFPGTLVLIFLFTAVFSMISIIEDRREGFLQSVLVAPVPGYVIVIGKILGSSSLAFVQGIPFLLIAPFVGIGLGSAGSFAASLIILFSVSFSLSAMGFIIAWKLDSTQGFHAVMNMFLIPMWLLSGALFPVAGMHSWLAPLAKVNPLTYCIAALQHQFFAPGAVGNLPSMPFCITMMALFCATVFCAALWVYGHGRR
ncbi:MAG: transport permease protein [bacterium]|nr:MAG: transport permease protein [bacterium]